MPTGDHITAFPRKGRKGCDAKTEEEARRHVLKRLDMLLRCEVDAFTVERTASGAIFIKVSPKVIIDRAA